MTLIRVFGRRVEEAKVLTWPGGRDISKRIPASYGVLLWLPWFIPWVVKSFRLNENGQPYFDGDTIARERLLVVKVP